MSEPNPSLAPSLRSLLAEERRGFGDHPELEEWMELRAGQVRGERQERLREHLAVCQECADLVLDLAVFTGTTPPEGVALPSDAQVKAALWQIQAELRKEAPLDAEDPPVPEPKQELEIAEVPAAAFATSPRDSHQTFWRRMPLGLIAASLLAVVGLVTWNQLRPAGAPQVNLEPTDGMNVLVAQVPASGAPGTTRGTEPRQSLEPPQLPVGRRHALALPRPSGAARFERYELTIVGEAGILFGSEDVELRSGLEGETGEGFTLALPRNYLPPGRYTIQVHGLDPGRRRELIAAYDLEMTP